MNIFSIIKKLNSYYGKLLFYIGIGIVIIAGFLTLCSSNPCWTDCFNHIEMLTSQIPLPNSIHSTLLYSKKLYRKYFPIKKSTRNVSNLKKKIVASQQQWKCANCSNILDYTYEIDHITPICKGGSNDTDNLQALCPHCHRMKTLLEQGS